MIRGNELLILALYVVPTVWAITDAVRIGAEVWASSGQSQVVWVVILLLLPVIGPALYLFVARPRLRQS